MSVLNFELFKGFLYIIYENGSICLSSEGIFVKLSFVVVASLLNVSDVIMA